MYIIDIEASGLASESYPIEIAWQSAIDEEEFDSFLIRPIEDWSHWDDYAEEHIHHISKSMLLEQGISARDACDRLNKQLVGKVVYSDALDFDKRWLMKLFDDLGIKPTFHIDSVFRLMKFEDASSFHEQIAVHEIEHRALADARLIACIVKSVLLTT